MPIVYSNNCLLNKQILSQPLPSYPQVNPAYKVKVRKYQTHKYANLPTPFRIVVPSDVQVGKYKIPFLVNVSKGSIFPSGFIEIPNFNLYITGKNFSIVNPNLIVTVVEPLTFDDKVREFRDTYGLLFH